MQILLTSRCSRRSNGRQNDTRARETSPTFCLPPYQQRSFPPKSRTDKQRYLRLPSIHKTLLRSFLPGSAMGILLQDYDWQPRGPRKSPRKGRSEQKPSQTRTLATDLACCYKLNVAFNKHISMCNCTRSLRYPSAEGRAKYTTSGMESTMIAAVLRTSAPGNCPKQWLMASKCLPIRRSEVSNTLHWNSSWHRDTFSMVALGTLAASTYIC